MAIVANSTFPAVVIALRAGAGRRAGPRPPQAGRARRTGRRAIRARNAGRSAGRSSPCGAPAFRKPLPGGSPPEAPRIGR